MKRFASVRGLSGWGLYLLLSAGALALRLYRLDAQSLWLDEGGTWAEVTGRTGKGWLAALAELWSPDAGYPLYHLLLRLWVQVAGDSEWALRFPSALSGALAVAVLMLVVREVGRLQGRAVRMWLVGVLAGLAPFALWHAQDAKAYSLLF
ncbi:MAG TPA: glycosyltransferase family 39 protein, partial [Roseiflexaceae bacterium]|nr:glycosyltransferase family 39 protein [Roseiflexaceae bacterium]